MEGGADLQRLVVGVARVEGHILDTLGRLEAASVSVRGVHGMVRSTEPHHLEDENFLAEVSRRAQADGQVDLSEGLDSISWCNTVKR